MKKIVGIQTSRNNAGAVVTTLHCVEDFSAYFNKPEEGKRCTGQMNKIIYVGEYDCSELKVGMTVEVYYDEPIKTKNAEPFAPIKLITVVNK